MATGEARLKEFFHWRVRRSFKDLGLVAPEAADYISATLARLYRLERVHSLESRGRRVELPGSVVEMLLAAEAAPEPDLERDIRRHEADYILFMAGLFRHYLERRRFFDFYLEQGRRDYRFVFEFERARLRPKAHLYLELAEGLPEFVGALNYMRQVFFRDRAEDPGAFRAEVDRLS